MNLSYNKPHRLRSPYNEPHFFVSTPKFIKLGHEELHYLFFKILCKVEIHETFKTEPFQCLSFFSLITYYLFYTIKRCKEFY